MHDAQPRLPGVLLLVETFPEVLKISSMARSCSRVGVVPARLSKESYRSLLLRLWQMASTHVAAQALPFNRTPPSITIPDLIFVERGYVRFTCGNFSDNPKRSPRTGSKLQSIMGAHI